MAMLVDCIGPDVKPMHLNWFKAGGSLPKLFVMVFPSDQVLEVLLPVVHADVIHPDPCLLHEGKIWKRRPANLPDDLGPKGGDFLISLINDKTMAEADGFEFFRLDDLIIHFASSLG
jgi:hypothetical protein